MDESEFELLFSVLKLLEQEDMKKSDVSKAITQVVDSFHQHMDEKQKIIIGKEFVKHVSKKSKPPEMPGMGSGSDF